MMKMKDGIPVNVIIYLWDILLAPVDMKKLFSQRLCRDLLFHQLLGAPVYTTNRQERVEVGQKKKYPLHMSKLHSKFYILLT